MYLHHSGQRGHSKEQEKLSWPEGKDNQETPSRTSHFPGELGEEPVVLGQVIESGWWGGESTASLLKTNTQTNKLFLLYWCIAD